MTSPHAKSLCQWQAEWIDADGRVCRTTDADVVRKRVKWGHDHWITPPPASILEWAREQRENDNLTSFPPITEGEAEEIKARPS